MSSSSSRLRASREGSSGLGVAFWDRSLLEPQDKTPVFSCGGVSELVAFAQLSVLSRAMQLAHGGPCSSHYSCVSPRIHLNRTRAGTLICLLLQFWHPFRDLLWDRRFCVPVVFFLGAVAFVRVLNAIALLSRRFLRGILLPMCQICDQQQNTKQHPELISFRNQVSAPCTPLFVMAEQSNARQTVSDRLLGNREI